MDNATSFEKNQSEAPMLSVYIDVSTEHRAKETLWVGRKIREALKSLKIEYKSFSCIPGRSKYAETPIAVGTLILPRMGDKGVERIRIEMEGKVGGYWERN